MNYVSPKVEIILIEVEKGFKSTGGDDGGTSLPDWEIISIKINYEENIF